MTTPAVLTAKQVADHTGRHHETVLLAARRGLLVGTQSGPGATWRFRLPDVDRWIEAGCPYRSSGRQPARKTRAA